VAKERKDYASSDRYHSLIALQAKVWKRQSEFRPYRDPSLPILISMTPSQAPAPLLAAPVHSHA